ncbi:DUF6928 family protein [Qipengyuania sp. DGS5-3]|uniref:DUF6928 family protein n=1 Tax=Qipengyuania sp. DGS5-3 TaxID=3349632 RepID=UPI0036D4012D
MGAKAWFVACFDNEPKETLGANPQLDRDASFSLAKSLLPNAKIEAREDGSLSFLNPDDGEIFVGVYGDLKIVAHTDLSGDFPSRIDARWRSLDLGSKAYLHATHSAVDWCSFALWDKGTLVRALGVSPDSGVQEDIGERLPFEVPFWDGLHSLDDEFEDDEPYPLPFHPLELSETALLSMLGIQFEGSPDDWVCDPEDVPIMKFAVITSPW